MMDIVKPSGDPAPARRKAGLRRWIRRIALFAAWLTVVVLCFALLGWGAFWWSVQHPTQIAKLGIDLFAPGVGLGVDEIDLDTPGTVSLRGVTLASDRGGESIRLESVQVRYSGKGIDLVRNGKLEALKIVGGQVTLDDAFMNRWLPSGDGLTEPEKAPTKAGDPPAWMGRAVPPQIEISGLDVAVAIEGVPRLAGTLEFRSEAFADLVEGDSGGMLQHLLLTNGRWKAQGEEVPVGFDAMAATFTVSDEFGTVDVAELELSGLKARLNPEGLAQFLSPADRPERGGEHPQIRIGKMAVRDAELSFSGFENLPTVSARADFEIGGLQLEGGRLRSAEEQGFVLRSTEIKAPGATGDPLLKWERAELRAVPDALLERGEVTKLHVAGLEIDVSKDSLGDLLDLLPQGSAEAPDAVATDSPAGDVAERRNLVVRDLRIDVPVLKFDPEGLFAGLPAASAKLEMRSEGETPDGDVRYGVELSEIAVRETAGSPKPFARGSKVTATLSALGLQRDGLIDTLTVNGLRAEVGDAVQRLMEAAKPQIGADDDDASDVVEQEQEEAKPDEDGGGPGLSVAKLLIRDTAVTLRDLIPGALPFLTIGLDTSLENVPLLGRSKGDEREQRIELKGVQIASPYNSLQNVAELKTVWIYFTIPGLFRSEIRRVEIVSPDVYVGEPLFWYVDYARKFAAGEPLEEEPVAAGPEGEDGKEGEPGKGDAIVEGLKAFELSGWRIGEIAAHSGRIIIAPTGIPLGIVPFPFEAKTDFAKGEISLEVEVPTGDYIFEQLELELRQLAGKAWVNYPVAAVNNNFVQTFKSPFVKFQQFEGSEAWLSVTYNEEGIFGDLGGRAYGGYVKGGFSIYVDGPYRWDAWVSGTEFDLGAFTNVLAPDNFKMSGVVDGSFVADGREFTVAKATGDLKTRAGGTMHVLKLDDLREALPEDWNPLWKALSNAGIDAFRDYRFDSGEAKLTYEAGEGSTRILFDGKQGRRDLRLRLFDRKGERAALGDSAEP